MAAINQSVHSPALCNYAARSQFRRLILAPNSVATAKEKTVRPKIDRLS